MPTYQYRCTECGEDLEAVQKFTDAALTECTNCGGSLRKIFNAVGVVFKGSGFYRTDSRDNGKGPKEKTEKSESSEKADKSGGSEKSGSEKSGAEKSGAEKSGAEKSGSDKKSGAESSGGSAKQPAGAGSASSTGKNS